MLYALVTQLSTGYIYDVGDSALEAVGTWNNTRIRECAIDMTFSGGSFYADFPSAITEIEAFHVQVRVNAAAAGSESITDWIKAQGEINWNGEAGTEITLVTINSGFTTVNQEVPLPVPRESRARIYI